MAGPYMAYRVTPNIRLDAKAAWGTAHDSAISGAESLSLDTNRMLTEARLSGNWGWNSWQLSQSGAVTYIDETSDGIARDSRHVGRCHALHRRPRIEAPYRHRQRRQHRAVRLLQIEPRPRRGRHRARRLPSNTIGGGVTLAKPDKYNISAVADFTENNDGGDQVATGKVLVTVPSRLLGF